MLFKKSYTSITKMSSDSDYSDAEEVIESDYGDVSQVNSRPKAVNVDGRNVRGRDIEWLEIEKFGTADEYKNSDIGKKISDEFVVRRDREFKYADVKIHHCKFARKVGYHPCPWQFKVSYLSHCAEVVVETNGHKHIHEINEEHSKDLHSVFKWTDEQTHMIADALKSFHKPSVIHRILNDANAFNHKKPTKVQLYNKISALKKKVFPKHELINTHQMRQRIMLDADDPIEDDSPFIPFWEVLDENNEPAPRFTIIFTTKNNQAKMSNLTFLQTDATYRLNWRGFPVFLIGMIL